MQCDLRVLRERVTTSFAHHNIARQFLQRFLIDRGIKRHGCPANCMPSGNPADESPGVIVTLSQLGHGPTTDLKSANAINRDRPTSWQPLDPARQHPMSVHCGTRQHIAASGQVPGQTEIQKDRPTIIVTLERGLQLLSRNPRVVLRRRAEGEEEFAFFRCFADCETIPVSFRWSSAIKTFGLPPFAKK
jgi:hypothetical protein